MRPAPKGLMPAAEAITVGIIDDNTLVRETLTALLARLPDIRVVAAEIADPPSPSATAIDVLLLDVGLGDRDSLRVAGGLALQYPGARIIVMDLLPVNEDIAEFVNAGVSGFVLKDATLEEFVETIRSVAAGKNVLPVTMTESLFAQIAREAGKGARAPALEDLRMTPREHDVISIIGEGLSNKEIAVRLNIATHTVKSHVRNVMEKLALHTRLEIAAYSHRQKSA